MSEQPHTGPDGAAGAEVRSDKLEAYMLGHYMGALSGVRLFDEAATTWAGTPYEERFTAFVGEIKNDIGHLEAMLDRLGSGRRGLAKGLGTVTGIASRLNPLSRIRERAGIAAHGELEMLQSLVVAKRSMWVTLLQLAPAEPRLDAGELTKLEADAADQYDRLRAIAEETARDRFLARS
ncbi:hypothetical protein AVL61_02180 [Kocuria rosea subsp. polaris]|uniref:Uncharacterized protein n=1 Tax=Kocuria rosea subsp. polaris TaxID=136273 RepID=A0A0W8IP38_KOCRO|nr:hypothetical protein [Kocuria polaris]KUG61732.1 hypothetical protein AVL61_02180 [Kocuria polaris]